MQTTTIIAQSAPAEMPTRLPIKETMKTAWGKVDGAKKVLFLAFLMVALYELCLNVLNGVGGLRFPYSGHATLLTAISLNFFTLIISVVLGLICTLIFSGGIYLGVRRSAGLPINLKMMLQVFRRDQAKTIIAVILLLNLIMLVAALPVIIFFLTWYLSSFLGLVMLAWSPTETEFMICFMSLACLGPIYIAIRASMALPLVLDRQISPLQAIKQSFRGTRKNFWRLLFIAVISLLCLLVSVLTIGIAGIWLAPFVYLLYGTVYQKLFGIAQQV